MTESRDTGDDRLEAIRMIRDSAAALIASAGGLQRVRSLRFADPGFGPAVYRQMAESKDGSGCSCRRTRADSGSECSNSWLSAKRWDADSLPSR